MATREEKNTVFVRVEFKSAADMDTVRNFFKEKNLKFGKEVGRILCEYVRKNRR
jgi:hypothetical protein